MKTISQWGRQHPKATIVLITFIHFILAFLWLAFGIDLQLQGVLLPVWPLYLGVILFLLSTLLYPVKKSGYFLFRYSYFKQKTLDLLLVLSAALMIITHANRTAHISEISSQNLSYAQPIVWKTNVKPAEELTKAEKKSLRKKIRENRKKLRTEIKAVVKKMRKENATGEQVIFTILTILAALLLLGLVAALSCSLSCSGAEGAAALVAILGVGLVVFLTIIALKAIFKEKSPKKVIY